LKNYSDLSGRLAGCSGQRKEFVTRAALVQRVEVDAYTADQIIFSGIFIVHLNVKAVVPFNDVECVLIIPVGGFATARMRFGPPLLTNGETGSTLDVAVGICKKKKSKLRQNRH
jgi:hypothetical protein